MTDCPAMTGYCVTSFVCKTSIYSLYMYVEGAFLMSSFFQALEILSGVNLIHIPVDHMTFRAKCLRKLQIWMPIIIQLKWS